VALSIDGNAVGQTPYSGSLTFGNHTLQIQQGEKKAEETVSISQTGGETSFSLSFGPQSFTETVNGTTIEMVAIKGGTFQMGSNEGENDEKPMHTVTVSDFSMGKTEVTQAQWIAVMGSNPSNFKGENLPVEMVSWDDIQVFINKLNAKTGKTYRLPTEAEWEYAAGASTGSVTGRNKYAGTDSESSLGNYAWYSDNSGSKTHPVGTKQPNQLGLYDMSGNVWEWCSDWYGADYYPNSPQNNPKGASNGSLRVLRGGSWYFSASYCRVSDRFNFSPGYRDYRCGFRLVRVS
jgi:formylglycine-generating enzyme required for sulfatase activity